MSELKTRGLRPDVGPGRMDLVEGELLPEVPRLSNEELDRLEEDYHLLASGEWPPVRTGEVTGAKASYAADAPAPAQIRTYVLERYGVDLGSEFMGQPVAHPFGKASGQLSLATHQVEEDGAAGLAFVVLKTVIAQDEAGSQGMQEWAIPEARMLLEPIASRVPQGAPGTGRLGWTITWKGRGWSGSLESYLTFVKESLAIGRQHGMAVVPSCLFYLPGPGESDWHESEYRYTVRRLWEVWKESFPSAPPLRPLLLEKDFSPTLAGSDRASAQEKIVEWVATVPRLVNEAARAAGGAVRLGVKLMNSRFDDDFQVELVRALMESPNAHLVASLTYANRLFDPNKVAFGKQGAAFGGPELSARNLRILTRLRRMELAGELAPLPPVSATGDVSSGKLAMEYALRGASTFQAHTVFQWPNPFYRLESGSKTARALHRLLFHPAEGLVAWLLHGGRTFGWRSDDGVIRWQTVTSWWYQEGARYFRG